MRYSSADKRRVYLAYRTVFAGPNALLRKPKKVREVIEVRQHVFRPLIKDFGLEKVIEIVIILLNGQIFQSELKAKMHFPSYCEQLHVATYNAPNQKTTLYDLKQKL
jgi:hypoxanthine-guanine phosphoribosyltransferase